MALALSTGCAAVLAGGTPYVLAAVSGSGELAGEAQGYLVQVEQEGAEDVRRHVDDAADDGDRRRRGGAVVADDREVDDRGQQGQQTGDHERHREDRHGAQSGALPRHGLGARARTTRAGVSVAHARYPALRQYMTWWRASDRPRHALAAESRAAGLMWVDFSSAVALSRRYPMAWAASSHRCRSARSCR